MKNIGLHVQISTYEIYKDISLRKCQCRIMVPLFGAA